jgi:hypothetical protein
MSARTYESLDALMGRILDLDARKLDLIADTRKMSLVDDGGNLEPTLQVDTADGVRTVSMSPYMQGQVATDLKIPKRYFDRMRLDGYPLFTQNLNYWFANEPERRMLRGYIPAGEAKDSFTPVEGRAWLSDRFRRLDHIEIARRILPEFENIGTEVQFHQAAITDTNLYLRAVFPRMQAAVKKDDLVQWGVEIRNSEVGSGMFKISGFVLRLVCINGMTVADEIRARHVGRRIEDEGVLSDEALRADDKAFWLAARDTLRATISETRFEEIVSQLRETQEGAKIEKPLTATETLQQRFSLSDAEREHLLTNLIAGQDLSRWGALNAMTAAAKSTDTFDRQVEMEGYGWAMATMPVKEWESVALA